MRTSHLAEKSSINFGHRSPRLAFVAVLLSMAVTQACGVANSLTPNQSQSQTASQTQNEIKITADLGKATVGANFSGTLSATGGTRPYEFSVIDGKLPAGLALHPETGAITGTPDKAETSDFTIRVLTANKKHHADLGLRLTVAAKQSGLTVTVTPKTATVASGANQQLAAVVSGGGTTTTSTSTVRWSASAGSVSTSGLFTAPTTTVATTATVTATSTSDPTASASAVISVTAGSSTDLSVSTTNLPEGIQGSSYLSGLAATGGSLPYQWSLSSGSLPNGLSLDSATGNLTGSPSKVGSFSFTAKVTDAASHSANAALSLTVVSLGSGKFDGPAELPRTYMLSALANTPANGKTWQVSDSNSLQSALTAAACGDTVKLQAGASFSGVFVFPSKSCDDQHWIIVRTSAADSSLPTEGTRITPCYAGVASLPGRPALNCHSTQNVMAKLVMNQNSGSGPIVFTAGANHYRFIGLEITRAANAIVGSLAFPTKGATADHLIFDRVWMHGTAKDDTTRGIYLSGISYVALVDSYLNDFHCESKTGTCTDSQTVSGGLGDTQDSVYKITNNFLESSGENILFGGGAATLTPTDIEVRHNHFFKPLTWKAGNPGLVVGVHGNLFIVKNHFELKNAQRVLFEGNLAENTWGGFSQAGFTLLLTPKNQHTPHGYVCPLCQVTDVTVRFSKFSHSGSGFQLANAEADGGGGLPMAGERYSFHDLILEDVNATTYNGQGQLAQVSSALGGPEVMNLQIAHVTAFPSNMLFDIGNHTSSPKMPNFTFANSIVTTGRSPIWSTGGGANNCAFGNVPANTLNNCFTGYTFGSNALVAVPKNYPPSAWPQGNTFMQDATSVGFVNFNSGNGGDYHLQPGSVCKNAGSDGKDLGADVNAIDAATAGAY